MILKTQKVEYHLELNLRIDERKVIGLDQSFDKILGKLEEDLIALQRSGTQCTELVRFCYNPVENIFKGEVHMQIPRVIKSIIAHENRMICDDKVYDIVKGTPIQDLDLPDMMCSVGLSGPVICMGHDNYSKFSVWVWNG